MSSTIFMNLDGASLASGSGVADTDWFAESAQDLLKRTAIAPLLARYPLVALRVRRTGLAPARRSLTT
jgi:hypothetical protein